MAICPGCGAEIDNLVMTTKVSLVADVRLDSSGERLVCDEKYGKDWDCMHCSCPQCEQDLGIYNRGDALMFLKKGQEQDRMEQGDYQTRREREG